MTDSNVASRLLVPWESYCNHFRHLLKNSGVNEKITARLFAQILNRYITLNDELKIPAGHTHGTDIKLTDSVNDAMIASNIGDLIGLTESNERMFYTLLVVSLDIGRLYQAANRCSATEHGQYSALECSNIFSHTTNVEHPIWEAFFLAVTHHGDRIIPGHEELGAEAYWLLHAARLIDKIRGFESAQVYCYDNDRKVAERVANLPKQIMTDPDWGKERGFIPEFQLEQFCSGQALDRSECVSYEAYMLQLLSWLFDVEIPGGLQYIINKGGPKIVLDYLRTNLSKNQFALIEERANLSWGKLS